MFAEVEKIPSLLWNAISLEALGLVGLSYNKQAPSWKASRGKRAEVQKLSTKKAALEKQKAKRGREETAESKAAMAKLLRDTAAADLEWPHPRNLPLADAQTVDGGDIVLKNGLYKWRKRHNDESNNAPKPKKQKAELRQLCEVCAALGAVTQVSEKTANGYELLCRPHKRSYGSLAPSPAATSDQTPEQTLEQTPEQTMNGKDVRADDLQRGIDVINNDPSYAAAARRAASGQRPKEFCAEIYMAYRLCSVHAAAVSSKLPSSLLGLLIHRLVPLELQIPGRFFELPSESDALGLELARDYIKTLPSRLGREKVVCIDEHIYRVAMELPPLPSLQNSDWDTAVALHPSGGVKNGVPYVVVGARLGDVPFFSLSISPNCATTSTFTPCPTASQS